MRPSLAGIAAWIVLAACSLTAVDQDIDVLLPAPPGHWQVAFQGLGFLVSAREASGRQTQVTFIGWESAARVRCARSVNAPILAWPFTPGLEPGTLRPAGGFFALTARHGRSGDAVELTWENGAAALVVDRVAAAGRDVSRFNVERLCAYMAREGDPWRLDLDSIAQKIAQGDLTAWDIDTLPSCDVSVSPGRGTWFLESPFSAPCAAEDGTVRLRKVPQGIHHLFSLQGRMRTLTVGGEEEPLLVP